MRLSYYFSKITRDKFPLVIGGAVVGVLSFWMLSKLLNPWVRPIVKDACVAFLDLKQDQDVAKERIVEVEAIRVVTGTMTKRIVTVGKLRANEEVLLRSEMSGRISEINFKEGEEVEKGDVLIQLENADQIAEVNLAKAEADKAEADHQRITKLHNQKIESDKKLDESIANVAIAKAKLDKATSQLEKSTIKAPFSGNIGLINVSVGAYIQGGQELVKLVDNSPIKVDFKVPEQNVHDVGVGQKAELKIDGFPQETISATVISVDTSLDEVSHSLSLRASTPNDDGRLRAGMFAYISLIVGEQSDAIVVPESSVTRDGEREFVWVIGNSKAGRRRVITGTRENGKVEIIQGLRPDELVVTAGQIKLGEGTKVRVANLEVTEENLTKEDLEASEAILKQEESAIALNQTNESKPDNAADHGTVKEASVPLSEEIVNDATSTASDSISADPTVEPENKNLLSKVFGKIKKLFSKN